MSAASESVRDSWDNPWTDTPTMQRSEEHYELLGTGELRANQSEPRTHKKATYVDGSTIDWLREEAVERAHTYDLRTLHGLRGVALPTLNTARIWCTMIFTGVGVGVIGAYLDILVQWLNDIRQGRCSLGLFYNQVTCCSGLDPGELCTEWFTWSDWLGIKSIMGSSLLQAFIYITLAIIFSASAAILVLSYAPHAFHTGIPEIKAILGGYVLDEFLGPWTLLIKSVGLALAVASGLSLGKEGPLVHVACCMAYSISRLMNTFQGYETLKRRMLAAAAASGISVAFGSPLGGVLFGLEELDTFANETEVMWRGFVTSVIAAVSLQYIDPFRTSKLVLFQVNGINDTWRAFELIPWLALSALGGVLGSMLIKLNVTIAVIRKTSVLDEVRILEVVGVTALTATISYLIVFMRVSTSELVSNLFQDCDTSRGDYHGLCNPNAVGENIFLLIITAAIKFGLTAWTFGMMVPAGIFLPTIAIGACLGRALGTLTQTLHKAYPAAWIFSSCPPDPTVQCVSPGFYAVIGASAMLGGVTRMTISLVVILFELTGALSHVLPIMISVMVSKWVADAFGKEGIYASWIALHRYPWLPSMDYQDSGQTATDMMVPVERLVTLTDHTLTTQELDGIVKKQDFYGYPVLSSTNRLLGFVVREKLRAALEFFLQNGGSRQSVCSFVKTFDSSVLDLSDTMEQAPVQLRKEVSQEFVVHILQKMNLRYVLFAEAGKLTGLVTKSDVVSLLTASVPYAGALAKEKLPHIAPSTDIIWEAPSEMQSEPLTTSTDYTP